MGNLVSSNEPPKSIVTDLFGGALLSRVTCSTCGHSSKREDTFLDLSLDIPETIASPNRRKSTQQQTSSVYDCLNSFTTPEQLSSDDLYHCEKCRAMRPCSKQFLIRRLPKVCVNSSKEPLYLNDLHQDSLPASEAVQMDATIANKSEYAGTIPHKTFRYQALYHVLHTECDPDFLETFFSFEPEPVKDRQFDRDLDGRRRFEVC